MKKDMVSIIVPVYNAEKYLKRCLESIINQTYKNIEVILVDDGSVDKSPEICDEYKELDNRVKVIHKENGGASSARNIGLDAVNGEFVCFVDSDDWIEKNMIEVLLKKLKESNVDIVRCNTCELDNQVKESWTETRDKVIDNVLNGNISAYVYLLIVKYEIVKNIRFNENILLMEDTLFLLNILIKECKINFINEKLYHYEMNNGGLTLSTRNAKNKIFGLIEYKNKVIELLKDNDLYLEEREKNINLVITKFIIYYSYKLSIQKVDFKYIFENSEIRNVLQNIDTNKLSIIAKIQRKNILNQKLVRFYIVNFLKKLVKKS